jgi:group I intron endonuclease
MNIDLYNLKILISGDYNAFAQENFNCFGVYMASGLAPSSFERPIYIGSAANQRGVKHRILSEHLPQLERNNHANDILQNYYNKNGDCLVWFLLESCEQFLAKSREQFYLDQIQPFSDTRNGFNIAKDASSPMLGRKRSKESIEKSRIKHLGSKRSEETKKKMSAAQSLPRPHMRGKKFSEERKLKISKGNSGKIRSKECREHLSKIKPKKTVYLLYISTGKVIFVEGITKFSRENGLNKSGLKLLYQGRLLTSQGYRLATPEEIRNFIP